MLRTRRARNLIHHHRLFRPNYTSITTTTTKIQQQQPNSFPSLLDLCNNPNHLQQIHARFILHGLHQNPTLSFKLIDTYANLGILSLSQQLFNNITNPTPTMYNIFLRNLCKFGEFRKTVLVYQEMVVKSVYPDECTYPFVLRSCLDAKSRGMVHGHVVKLGFDSFNLVGSALVDVYRGVGSNYFTVNDVIEEKSGNNGTIYWNSLILEAFRNCDPEESFRVFKRMRIERIEPDSITVINLLRAVVRLGYLKLGHVVHGLVFVSNLCQDLAVNTALLTMYSKLGSLENAKLLFEKMPKRDRVVWNLMISANSNNGYPIESLELLFEMVSSGTRADMFTAMAAISSIAELKCIKLGKEVHAHVIRNGLDYQVSVHNSLIDMYCKCDGLIAARKVFDFVTDKSVVSWSSIIRGYVKNEQFYDAFSLFAEMKLNGFKVDSITVINILPACVNTGALEQVKYLHGYSIKDGLDVIPSVNTALLVSYAKCGCIQMARQLFDEEENNHKDIITWNSMISAYSKHGEWHQCFELYNRMRYSKLRPDRLSFLGVLTACVNSGSVKEGWECFKEMTDAYGYQPNQEHYACMVDLLGRAGHVKEASELINSMPFEPDARVLGPLLSGCKLHSDPRLAEVAAERLINMEPRNAANYILLSNIYAAAGKWDGVAKMRTFLRDRGLKKTPGYSWLEINGHVHEFRVADKSHPQSDNIYTVLGNLELEIKELRKKTVHDKYSQSKC